MKNLSLSLLVMMIMLLISSCTKFGTSSSVDVLADVYVRSFLHNGAMSYNVVHSVSSSLGITATIVDVPGGTSFTLSDYNGDGSYFYKDTSMVAGFNPTPPPTGAYTYHVYFKSGDHKDYTNTLSSEILVPPVIDSLYKKPYGTIYQSLRLRWKPVVGAQYYQIRITSGQNEIQPWGLNFTDQSDLVYERMINDFSRYLPGTITFEIRAIKYETSDNQYVQAVSQNSISIDL